MRAAYRVLAVVVMVGVALQVASIAFGVFGLEADAEDGATVNRDYQNFGLDWHSIAGTAMGVVVLALLVVSFFAKVERGRTLAGVLVGLVLLQLVLATVAFGVPAVGALHGLNGLAIGGIAAAAARRTVAAPVAEPANA